MINRKMKLKIAPFYSKKNFFFSFHKSKIIDFSGESNNNNQKKSWQKSD